MGLGTNLFSKRKTLEEELEFDYLNTELAKNSNFYNQYVLQDDYVKLLKKADKDKIAITKR